MRKPPRAGVFFVRRAQQPLRRVPYETSNTQANPFRRPREIAIPSHDDSFVVPQFERGRQVDRVVTAQSQVFGVLAGTNRKLLIDANRSQVRVQLLKVRERLAVLIRPEPIQSTGSREGRSALRIGEDA